MVALLALIGLRLRAFTALRIGTSFVGEEERWWIRLDRKHIKTRRRDHWPVDRLLTDHFDRWDAVHRPAFAGAGDALWPSLKGGALDPGQIHKLVCQTTQLTLGMAIPPQLIRVSVGSSAAFYVPENPYLDPALLQHVGRRTFEEAYERVSSMSAARSLQEIIRQHYA